MWHNQSHHEEVLEDYFVKIVLSIWVKVGGLGTHKWLVCMLADLIITVYSFHMFC